MTIFWSFNHNDLAIGAKMDANGFTDFAGIISTDGVVESAGVDPDWTIEAAPVGASGPNRPLPTYDGYIAPPGYRKWPRTLHFHSTAIIRAETVMRDVNESVLMLASDDGLSFIVCERNFYNNTHALEIKYYTAGTQVSESTWYYFAQFNVGGTLNPTIESLPSAFDLTWVVDGTKLYVYVNGAAARFFNYAASNAVVDYLNIPVPVQGAKGIGYYPGLFLTQKYTYPLIVRDNNDLIYIQSKTFSRANTTQSKATISGTCSITGATQVQIQIKTPQGATIYSGTTPVSGGVWTLTTTALSRTYEKALYYINTTNASNVITVTEKLSGTINIGASLRVSDVPAGTKITSQLTGTPGGPGTYQISNNATATKTGTKADIVLELEIIATNIGGGIQTRTGSLEIPRTLVQVETRVGNNIATASYYSWWPFNNLSKSWNWRTGSNKYVRRKWMDDTGLYGSDQGYGTGNNYLAATQLAMDSLDAPLQFPADGSTLDAQMPWLFEPGDYVVDCSQCPNLQWVLYDTNSQATITNNFYGTNKHKLTLTGTYVPTTTGSGIRINFTKNTSLTNNGMPTVHWEMPITKYGTIGYWAASYLAYEGKSGVMYKRWMSTQAIEVPKLPRNTLTEANRSTIESCSWEGDPRAQIPFELIVELHNKTRKHLWYNFSRLHDESYVRFCAEYVRDNLDPDLKFIWTRSNEVWNFAQQQVFSYGRDGLAIGLGRGRTAALQQTSGSTTAYFTVANNTDPRTGLTAVADIDLLQSPADSRLTISGAANGTRVNSSGYIVAATSPRYDYDPITLEPRGIMNERATTNLIIQSSNFTTAWSGSAATASGNVTTGPDNTTSADKIIPDGTSTSNHYVGLTVTIVNGSTYTYSFYAKAAGNRYCKTFMSGIGVGTAVWDLQLGVVVQDGGAVRCTIEPGPLGFWRCRVTGVAVSTSVSCRIYSAKYTDSTAWVGDGTSGTYAYGAQLEEGAEMTSLVHTTGSTVTRSADSISITGSDFSGIHNQSEGVYVVDFSLTNDSNVNSGNRNLLEVSDGTTSERHLVYNGGGEIRALVTDGGVDQASITVGGTTPRHSVCRVAYAYKLNNFNVALNGVIGTVDSSGTVPTPDRIILGQNLCGHIRKITYYATRPTDSVVASLSLIGMLKVGQYVSGPYIPTGTKITATSGYNGQVTLSHAPTKTLAANSVFFDSAVYGGDEVNSWSSTDGFPAAWVSGTNYAKDSVVSHNFFVWKSRARVSSSTIPQNDPTKWEKIQDGNQAAIRSHIEHMLETRDWIVDVFGSEDSYEDRCWLVAETWVTGFADYAPTYLDWGSLKDYLKAICVGIYFGSDPGFYYGNSDTPAEVTTATTTLSGQARIDVWIKYAKIWIDQAIARYATAAAQLVGLLEERGRAEGTIPLWCYEWGQEWGWFDWPGSTGFQNSLRADIYEFGVNQQYDLYLRAMQGLKDAQGGWLTHFDDFSPVRQFITQVNRTGYRWYGAAEDNYALNDDKVVALREFSLANGGSEVEIEVPVLFKRRRNIFSYSE